MDEYVAAERSDYVSWGYDDYAKEDEIYWSIKCSIWQLYIINISIFAKRQFLNQKSMFKKCLKF